MKVSVTIVVLMSLVLCSAFFEVSDASSASLQSPPGVPDFCAPKCMDRCSRNPRNLCKKLCMMCCVKCKCVPNGPLADKAECPCYRDMKNSKGQSKCP